MGNLKNDLINAAVILSNQVNNLDFSIASLKVIEGLLLDCFEDGKPKKDGYLGTQFGQKLFGISAYIGEVIIRNTKTTKWVIDENDPQAEINIQIHSVDGIKLFPGHKLMKRVKNGPEDNLFHYVQMVVNDLNKYSGEIPKDFFIENKKKPWWRFW